MNPFSKEVNVSALGEKKLIERVCARFGSAVPPPPFGPGDDCALMQSSGFKKNVFVTSDAVVLGRHFSPEDSPAIAGGKLVKRNISDIAAMGASPFAATISALASPNISLDWLDEFCGGVGDTAAKYGIKILGGDFASTGNCFFSAHMTLWGHSDGRPLLRSGASEGDLICVTGELGASFESGWHLSFEPKIEEGAHLSEIGKVTSCIDVSDGVASDLKWLLPSGSCAEIWPSKVPLREFGGCRATLEKALCDGEDYELLFTFSGEMSDFNDFSRGFALKFGKSPIAFGRIKKAQSPSEESALVIVSNGSRNVFRGGGFDHYHP